MIAEGMLPYNTVYMLFALNDKATSWIYLFPLCLVETGHLQCILATDCVFIFQVCL